MGYCLQAPECKIHLGGDKPKGPNEKVLQSIYSIDLISRRHLETFTKVFVNITLQKYFPHTDATSRRPHRRPDGRLDEATRRRRRRPRSERRLRRQQLPVQ